MSEYVGDSSEGMAIKSACRQFDSGGRAARFIERTRRLTEFASRELGAYQLFRTITDTLDDGAEYDVNEKDNLVNIHYPLIDYQPDPSDSDTRRQIALRLELRTSRKSNDVLAITPWLRVFTLPDLEEHGLMTDHADPCFMRTELEVICGSQKEYGDSLFEPMLDYADPSNAAEFGTLLDRQEDYIEWLKIAAAASGVPTSVYANFMIPENDRYYHG